MLTHQPPALLAPQVFCHHCQFYLGLHDFCTCCGRSQPAEGRTPPPGQPHWAVPLPAPWPGELALTAGAVLAADSAGRLLAHDLLTGAPCWPPVESGAPLHPLALAAGRLYAAARREAWLAAFELATGAVHWRFPLADSAGPPAAHDDQLFVGDSAGQLHLLHDLGARAEERRPPIAVGFPLAAPPMLWRGALIVLAQHHRYAALAAFDISSRRAGEIWRYPLPGTRLRHLVLDGDLALVTTDHGHLHAVDLASGRAAWPAPRPLGGPPGRLCPPLVTPEALWLGAAAGTLTPCDRRSGQPLAAPTHLGSPLISLALGAGLLLAATQDGRLLAFDPAAAGRPVWSRPLGGIPTSSLAAAGDRFLIATALPDGPAQLLALPWHGGDLAWGSQWAERLDNLETAAALAALADNLPRAAGLWLRAGRPDLAGAIWHGRSRDAEAGATFQQAADQISATYPQRAAGLYSRAADSFQRAGLTTEEEACRRRAGRQGHFAALTISPLDPPDLEAGSPGTISFHIENRGNLPATHLTFELRGPLAQHLQGSLARLPANSADFLDFEDVTPMRVGQFDLTLFFKYDGAGESGLFAETRVTVTAGPPPDLDLLDDAGAVIVRVPPGTPPPRVRARKMVGMLKFEAV